MKNFSMDPGSAENFFHRFQQNAVKKNCSALPAESSDIFSALKRFFFAAFIALSANLTLVVQIYRKSHILLVIFSDDTSTRGSEFKF